VNVYGLDIIYPHPLYQGMVRALLPRFDRVVAISQAARQLVVDRGVAPERVTIVHPGIRFSEFETQPDRAKLREDLDLQGRLVLLIAGRLAKRKGVLEFVHFALPAIVDRHPETLLVVAGGNPTDSLSHKEDIQSLLRREIREQGLEDHVRLLGRVKRAHLVKLFQACDLFILPAIPVEGDMEGFGIVLVEASAAGKPVVSTRLGGIPDAVAEGESGVLVEPEAWEALVAAITSLLADEGARRELGASGRRRARTKLDWSVIGERYAEGLREVVGAGPIEESFALHHDQKEGR
jgi:phosphatidylinositol alpha-1,6-mannosyltransferase